ncbi:uncharacterized protein LOC110974933 isoform X4 [Acanthaster planci]|uniref:Uncharacterized protein LOC110974933 isoform X4 n=1 Tax=Acanthaster planci TaxID=133434 RepID=A0A8B7XR04_ACAPL|nr:uncharacterized protein LOC110974933 isoform X4 [Acanthaster planci]
MTLIDVWVVIFRSLFEETPNKCYVSRGSDTGIDDDDRENDMSLRQLGCPPEERLPEGGLLMQQPVNVLIEVVNQLRNELRTHVTTVNNTKGDGNVIINGGTTNVYKQELPSGSSKVSAEVARISTADFYSEGGPRPPQGGGPR